MAGESLVLAGLYMIIIGPFQLKLFCSSIVFYSIRAAILHTSSHRAATLEEAKPPRNFAVIQ